MMVFYPQRPDPQAGCHAQRSQRCPVREKKSSGCRAMLSNKRFGLVRVFIPEIIRPPQNFEDEIQELSVASRLGDLSDFRNRTAMRYAR